MAKVCNQSECPMYNSSYPMLGAHITGGNPEIMILTDSPDIRDKHRTYSSDSAMFLSDKLDKAEFLRDKDVILATSVLCYCDQNELSESLRAKAVKCCRQYFLDTVKKFQPKLILSFGGMALTQATKNKGVKKYQGTFQYSEELKCHVFPMYAPGYIQRNQSHEETWVTGFNQVKNFIDNGWKEADIESSGRILQEVQSIKGLFTLAEAEDGIAIDTETQGLDWTHPHFVCVSYSIAPTPMRGYQIYLFEECSEEEKDFSILWTRKQKSKNVPTLIPVKRSANFEEKLKELRWFLENDKIKKIMHNGNYDCHVFNALFKMAGRLLNLPHHLRGIDVKGYNFDTQNAAQLYNENVYGQARLESLQFAFSDVSDRYDSGDFKINQDKGDMLGVPKEALTHYAILDTIVTKAVSVNLKKYLSENPKLDRYMQNMVVPTLETMREMEKIGAYVDQEALDRATIDITKLRDESHAMALSLVPAKIKEAHAKAGLKLSRNALIKDILYSPEGFRLAVKNKTKSGEPSTDQDTIKLLMENVKSDKIKTFIQYFVDYKKYDKLAGTYLDGFRKATASDKRIHTKYSSCFATTGRLASSKPNLMNIPNRGEAGAVIRRIISVPEGWKILKADASQAELRWMAHYAQDREMIKIFREGIIDIHTATAMSVSGYTDMTWAALSDGDKKYLRKQAKAINFGLCLKKGTEVITSKGVKLIEDIKIGDSVLTHKKRFRKVIALQQPVATGLFKITTKTGRVVECTSDHMMLVHFPSANGRPGRKAFLPANELKVGDYLVHHETTYGAAISKNNISSDEARIIGWYISEGSNFKNQFTISQSRDYNPEICNHMDVLLKLVGFKQCRDNMTYSGTSAKLKTLLDKGKVTYNLKSYGIDFDINHWLCYSAEIRSQLIAGMWDGDGCVHYAKEGRSAHVTYSSASMPLLGSLRKLLDSLGMTSTIYSYPHKRTNVLHITGSVSILKFLNSIPTTKALNHSYAPKKQFAAEEKIESIEFQNVTEVTYDFTVEDDHSFTANGLFTHNCYGMSVQGYVTYAKTEYGIMNMTEEEGQKHRDGFFKTYSGLEPFYEKITRFGQKYGYVESVLGRRRNLPELNSKNKGLFNQAVRQAINFPIQSASSDTVLLAANEIMKMKLPPRDFKLMLFIHDELVSLVREDCDINKYAHILKDSIENPPLKELFGVTLSVPLEAEVEYGNNLNDCSEWKFS